MTIRSFTRFETLFEKFPWLTFQDMACWLQIKRRADARERQKRTGIHAVLTQEEIDMLLRDEPEEEIGALLGGRGEVRREDVT